MSDLSLTLDPRALVDAAVDAMTRAYAPYSHFHVGAALLAADGRIFCGCNIENAAYPVTICAERAALSAAVSAGVREFAALAVVGGHAGVIDKICTPCGLCRQAVAEFCSPEMPVFLGHAEGITTLTLKELLPYSFSLTEDKQS